MALSKSREDFIVNFWSKCNEICPKYGLNAIDAIVAQACCESRYGESGLSKYHNYWGMKCGSSYKGKSVNMATKEEYQPGVISNIRDNFRAYNSMEEGIKGYCEFITGFSRYSNLKGVTDSHQYFVNLKNDGWATSSTYVSTLDSIVPTVQNVMKNCVNKSNAQNNQGIKPATQTKGNSVIKKGQKDANSFVNHDRIAEDGIRGANTKKMAVRVLQHAMNLDYNAGLDEDGIWGNESESALGSHYVKKGERQYMVTAAEILYELKGINPKGVEYPGKFGDGLESACGKSKITASDFKALLK